jgi:hypothetical protein
MSPRPVPSANAPARRRWPGALAIVLPVLVIGIGFALVGSLLGLLQNPFGTTTRERDNAVVLARLEDLSRYEAATGRFQTLVDQEQDANLLPDWVKGERTVLSAEGDVEAYVDLGGLDEDAVVVSDDGRAVTVHLPEPALQEPRLDLGATRVVARDRGLIDRIDDALTSGSPSVDDRLYERAEEKLGLAAADSDLRVRAERNTTDLITDLLSSAGYERVIVVFDSPQIDPASAT